MDFPRIMIAALCGGSGKTILSIGIIAAWKKLGKFVTPFKKGPDYIDAGWLTLAAGRPCHNLDTFLIPEALVYKSFLSQASKNAIAVIEGNRGLYDGIDLQGFTSTAELAKLLKAPVILCLDCTKTTRTAAAVVLGCQRFDPDVFIKGVILNRVAGGRHERILRQTIETYCGIPVLGAVPKLGWQNFPERHMGLLPTPEHAWANDSIADASQMAAQYLDLEALDRMAHKAEKLQSPMSIQIPNSNDQPSTTHAENLKPKVGIIRDSAFQFYYPENIEALIAAGAETVFFSPLDTETIPPIDGLYIGGGFPETHAEKLAANGTFKNNLKILAEEGLPIYAECGGLMYLGKELNLKGKSYPMVGVLPVVYGFSEKPQGHGYTIVSVERPNPYFTVGTELRGHEFHYSHVLELGGDDPDLVFFMKRGNGIKDRRDGVCYKNVLATYTHIHALGTPLWAQALVRNAIAYKKQMVKNDFK